MRDDPMDECIICPSDVETCYSCGREWDYEVRWRSGSASTYVSEHTMAMYTHLYGRPERFEFRKVQRA